jgi:hypothetical protein
MGDIDDIDKIFQIVDSDGSGYLSKEKLQRICPHLSPSEIDIIFNDLDTDRDNRVSLKEFTHGFKELIKPNDNHRLLNTKKLINQKNIIGKEEIEDLDLTTNMTHIQTQINEVFNSISWYDKR